MNGLTYTPTREESGTDSHPELPSVISDVLGAIRSRLRWYLVLETAAWLIGWCVTMFWGGFLFDYLPVQLGTDETPVWFRAAWLAATGLGALTIVAVRLVVPLSRRLRREELAMCLERTFPTLNESLVTVVESRGMLGGQTPRDRMLTVDSSYRHGTHRRTANREGIQLSSTSASDLDRHLNGRLGPVAGNARRTDLSPRRSSSIPSVGSPMATPNRN